VVEGTVIVARLDALKIIPVNVAVEVIGQLNKVILPVMLLPN
jgi:hypothetical protein